MTYGYPQSRLEAQQMGADRYDGAPCKVCTGTIRYLSNGNCVNCQSQRGGRYDAQNGYTSTHRGGGDPERAGNAKARRDAQEIGARRYDRISPCPKCIDEGRGYTTLRYTTNGCCVACLKAKSDETYRRNAGYLDQNALPIVPCACSCRHGSEATAFIPELNGKSLTFVKHPWGGEITGEKPHYGKCIYCHPSRAITLYNKMVRDGGMPAELRQVGMWLSASMTPRPELGYPRGYLAHCMASFNSAHMGRSQPATETPLVLPLPSPLEQQMADNLKRLYEED